MHARRPVPPEPPNPFGAPSPAETAKTEQPFPPIEPQAPQAEPVSADVTAGSAIESPIDFAAALEDAEAYLAEAEALIKPKTKAKPPANLGAVLEKAEARLAEAETRLAEAEARATEQHEAWLRAKAETENVRRRAQEDIAKASKFASEKFAGAMLPVKDSLEAALTTEAQTLEELRKGVELTLKQLAAAFESANLTEENPLGQKFDPNKHQAIGAYESDAEPNTVINVLQKGYLLHERVIRPAMVAVAKAKA